MRASHVVVVGLGGRISPRELSASGQRSSSSGRAANQKIPLSDSASPSSANPQPKSHRNTSETLCSKLSSQNPVKIPSRPSNPLHPTCRSHIGSHTGSHQQHSAAETLPPNFVCRLRAHPTRSQKNPWLTNFCTHMPQLHQQPHRQPRS